MANMSYCRFENTLADLRDCNEHMDEDLSDSPEEAAARSRLLELCDSIVKAHYR